MLKTYCEINFFTADFRESQCTVQLAKSDSDAMSSLYFFIMPQMDRFNDQMACKEKK